MIREKRNKEKLASYYRKFMEDGVIDPNVHPWVAESWQRCRAMKLPHETMPKLNKLSREEIVEHQKTHEFIVKYVDGLYEQSKQHFNIHNLSMLLIDEDGYVIKNYALPFFQRVIEDIQGMRVLEEDVGTSSISIAREHNVPFLMFGPEMWIIPAMPAARRSVSTARSATLFPSFRWIRTICLMTCCCRCF